MLHVTFFEDMGIYERNNCVREKFIRGWGRTRMLQCRGIIVWFPHHNKKKYMKWTSDSVGATVSLQIAMCQWCTNWPSQCQCWGVLCWQQMCIHRPLTMRSTDTISSPPRPSSIQGLTGRGWGKQHTPGSGNMETSAFHFRSYLKVPSVLYSLKKSCLVLV